MEIGGITIDGQPTLCIGCIQAKNRPHTKEALARITKDMHGQRPKLLLLEVAKMLAQRWSLPMRGIDPDAHPFTSLRYQLSSRKRKRPAKSS